MNSERNLARPEPIAADAPTPPSFLPSPTDRRARHRRLLPHRHLLLSTPPFPPQIPRNLRQRRIWLPVPIALRPPSSASGFDAAYFLLLGLLLGSFLDILLVGLIKHLVCHPRPRPIYNRGMSSNFAVDHWFSRSGRSSRIFFIATFLRLSLPSLRHVLLLHGPIALWIGKYYEGDRAELFLWIASIWSVVSSASCVLGRHFVLDVVAGACLGILEAHITFYFIMPLFVVDRVLAI